MKHLGFWTLVLSIFLAGSAHAESPTLPVRHFAITTSSAIAASVKAYIQNTVDSSGHHLFALVKEIKGYGGVTRALAFLAKPSAATQLRTAFYNQGVTVSVDKKATPQVYAKGQAAVDEAGTVSVLNMWGPMRILGHLPGRTGVTGAAGTKVCVSDTGINWNHPRLKSRVIAQVSEAWDILDVPQFWYDFLPNELDLAPDQDLNQYSADKPTVCDLSNFYCQSYADGEDDDGHGSHVSGIIAATEVDDGQGSIDVVGIDPTAQLIAAKGLGWHWVPNDQYDPLSVLPPYDPNYQPPFVYDYFGYYSDLANTIWDCMDQGAQVINMSWGGGDDDLVHAALADAHAAGIILVAAAGNEYDPSSGTGPVIYPARHPEVISVSALGIDGQIAPFSSRGTRVDFMAPGVAILSTTLQASGANGTYDYYSGTSMAAPHVTGTISRMLATAPYASQGDLVGSDIGLSRFQQGQYGLINVELSTRR